MKILVCISKAPDTTSKIAFTDNNSKFDENGVQYIVNPYDEWYALVRALEIKESIGASASVTIVSVGGADYEPVIRKALAIGADEAVRIDAAESDSLYVAKQIAAYAKGKNFDIIFCGKETINYNGSVVPGMVAELLDLPYVALAHKLELSGNTATIEREIPGGEEVVEVNTPFVLSAAKGMAEQRIPNMRGIMAARTKPLAVEAAASAEASTTVKAYSLPPAKSGCKYIAAENAGDLIKLLHEEAKAL
jgi:electron transfer flavoprotein beta subunit